MQITKSKWCVWFAVGSVLMAMACTRASKDRRKGQLPKAALSKALSVDITTFAPSASDTAGVWFRLDRIRNTPLGAATEMLFRPLPDYTRVFGGTGRKALDVFDAVLITSSRPTSVVATNMAARMAIPPRDMRALLDNKAWPTDWRTVVGGAASQSRSPIQDKADPRGYLIPMRNWIVMAHPAMFGAMLAPRTGNIDTLPTARPSVSWIAQVPSLMHIGGASNRLLMLSTLRKLPASVTLPIVGKISLPRRSAAAVERHKGGDVISGVLSFDTPEAAAKFASVLAGARQLLAGYQPKGNGPAAPALAAVRKLKTKTSGNRVTWTLVTTFAETVALVRYATAILSKLMQPPGPVPIF